MKTLAYICSVLTLSVTGLTSQASAHGDLDELAYDVQQQTRHMLVEFRAHYSHTPEFRHLMADTQAMYGIAAQIHDAAHFGGNPIRFRNDVQRLDSLFHHLEEVVARVEHGTLHGIGHKHGNTRHVRRLMRNLENDIHELAVLTQYTVQPVYPVQPIQPVYPARPYQGYRNNRFNQYNNVSPYSNGFNGGVQFQIRP